MYVRQFQAVSYSFCPKLLRIHYCYIVMQMRKTNHLKGLEYIMYVMPLNSWKVDREMDYRLKEQEGILMTKRTK